MLVRYRGLLFAYTILNETFICVTNVLHLGLFIGYARTAINDGPGCLSLRCPSPDCNAAVGEKIILPLVSEEDKMKYMRYILRSYVEANRKVRNCLIGFIFLCFLLI